MGGFMQMLASERLKLSKSPIWLLVLVSPLISLAIGMLDSLNNVAEEDVGKALLSSMSMLHGMLLMPIMTGILSAFVCRYEHGGGGWKQLLSLPVSRTSVYTAKLSAVALLLLAGQLLFVGAASVVFLAKGVEGGIAWELILPSAFSGWAACLPLAALQLGISIGWSSFAAPLVVNVMLTLPNMLVVNSAKFGPFYPWAQPVLLMLSNGTMDFGGFTVPFLALLLTVGGSFIVFTAGSLVYFRRKEL
ncbi:ABC transporter permease [Paenibacillus sp. NPDC058174]|uniref:ABC transporter permease n=1 Tax=Paenibacillus sp. NPDC058174 TaxID=3346366 RepID=UPI0036DC7170